MGGRKNWELIRKDYLNHIAKDGKCNLIELAKKYKVNVVTLRSKKCRDRWDHPEEKLLQYCNTSDDTLQLNGNMQRNTDKQQNGEPILYKIPKPEGGQPENKNALKHGLYARYLPKDVLEIMDEISAFSPIEMLLMNAEMLQAQIIRAMKIMHVRDKNDMTKEISSLEGNATNIFKAKKVEYELQFAWDKHASFLRALSFSMREYRNLVKELVEYDNSGLMNEEQRLRLQKLRLEIKTMEGEKENADNDWISAVLEAAERREKDEPL